MYVWILDPQEPGVIGGGLVLELALTLGHKGKLGHAGGSGA